jgi:hypothetical protein
MVKPSTGKDKRAAAPASMRPRAHLISRAEMARMLGLSRPAITKACREGGRLAPACDGNSINVLHAQAQRWLVERAVALGPEQLEAPPAPATPRRAPPELDAEPPAPAARTPRRRPAPAPAPVELPPIEVDDDEPENAQSIEDLEEQLGPLQWRNLAELAEPLTVLTERYGDARDFEGWIRARKALEEARKAQMIRERIEGRVIARTTVVRMFEHIDTAFRLLLSDAPRSIATRIAPQDVAAVAALVRDVMGQHLSACRSKIDVSLANDDPMAPLAEAAE